MLMETTGLDLILTGATVMLPGGSTQTDVGLKAGKIVALGDAKAQNWQAAQTIALNGLHLLPGVIDSQVHFREPGLTHKEDLESGTRGAVMGGVTTVFEMPNTSPSTTSAEAMQDKLNRAQGRCWSNYAFYMGVSQENATELTTLERLPGVCGTKLFMGASTGDLLVSQDEWIELALRHSRRRMAIHSEDNDRLTERKALLKPGCSVTKHPFWRDDESALRATQRVLALANKTSHPMHLLHITTAEEIALLAKNKHITTVEVLPQHLTLSAPECYERLGTLAQMNPPIREKRHQEALWKGIELGIVDVLGSDHAPHTLEEKARPYPESPAGLTGVQTILPLMLNHVNNGKLSLERLVDLLCYGPARVFNLANKGRVAVGFDADLTVVDLKAQRTITNSWIESRVGWSPFDGMAITGWPVMTIVGGHVVMRDDERLGTPIGQPCRFWDTISPA